MNYLFYGTNHYNLKKEIDSILKDKDDLNISKYDMSETAIDDILNDALTMSLFEENKVIICENALVFSPALKAEASFEEYLNNPNPNTTIIFVLNEEKLDERKKVTKLIKKNGIVKEFNEINPNDLVKELLKDYDISPSSISLLIQRVGNNLDILTNEVDKIILYKDNDKKITAEDILNLTHKTVDTDVFKLIDYIVTNDKKNALEIYYELIKRGEEPLKIIIMLSNQFRIIYQSKTLKSKGYSEKDIAEVLKIHPYRVKLAIQKAGKYSNETLLKYLSDFADMDMGIKSGKVSKNNVLEMFILEK